jgi:CHAT domain-containing protein
MAALGALDLRLGVVSACQTAVADITDAADEALSIGTAMIASGSACVIASLWPVDDYVTALLMVGFYERLVHEPQRSPRDVLVETQRWLRGLTETEHRTFTAEHPALEIERSRRRRNAGYEAKARSGAPYPGERNLERPFSDPVDWAPFVAYGA